MAKPVPWAYSSKSPSSSSSSPSTCPSTMGGCVDVLGGVAEYNGLGNSVENACCPLLQGLVEVDAAMCLCTTMRRKLINPNRFIPLALQALATCGKIPPPGFTCPRL
ncbi:hypothetical protein L1049_002001 [Liquidambar formosana]|uniref:Bifunctional inhibitor/plant lipid transfer protein/seed storage helical domain-containing protein n=1 Tax=Liquidambar formosana TaxID=63359 RepID=A0AAP0NEU8_LIQFO